MVDLMNLDSKEMVIILTKGKEEIKELTR